MQILDVEAELHDVTVNGMIFLAFNTNLANFFGLIPSPKFKKFIPVNNFGFDEPALEVGVNATSTLRGT